MGSEIKTGAAICPTGFFTQVRERSRQRKNTALLTANSLFRVRLVFVRFCFSSSL